MTRRILVTHALPYANGPKHIGHLAGAYLPADIYVRYLRAQKRDVVYVCGSDEHGAAITIQAMKEKTTPREIVDKYHAMLKSNILVTICYKMWILQRDMLNVKSTVL